MLLTSEYNDAFKFVYSTMPRPLEPVERAAFFSECTLAGLRECINQPG